MQPDLLIKNLNIFQTSNFDIGCTVSEYCTVGCTVFRYERQLIFDLNHYTRNFAYETETWLVGLRITMNTIDMIVHTFPPGAFITNMHSGAPSKLRLAE